MPTAPTLILITNCAATKRIAAGEPVLLRNWKGSVRQRFHWWRKAIEKRVSATTVRDCYAGDAWSQAIASEKVSPTKNQLWVLSAGLGLLSADQTIPSYSATFVNNDLDSVASDHLEKTDWWKLLVEWRRELTGVGCITDLALANPESVIIVAVSSTYLSVIKDDLVSARVALASPDSLLVISAGTSRSPALGASLLPIDARFENFVGGARATLNARMLRHIVEKYKSRRISAPQVSEYLSIVATNLVQPRSFERLSLNDKQIAAFIRKQSKLIPRSSASAFLRILRDGGSACEQKRFHRIYKAIHPNKV
jgi:hypothetical protein